MKYKKENLVNKIFVFGLILIFCLNIFAVNVLAPDTSGVQETVGKVSSGVSQLQNLFGGVNSFITDTIGGPWWMHSVLSGGFSALNTYSKLGEKVRIEVERDKVNLSDQKQDYSSENEEYLNQLKINLDPNDPKTDVVLTDKNTLDIEYIETIDDFYSEYYDPNNNPNMRIAQATDELEIRDWNSQNIRGQKRGLLFDDKNETIQNVSEYRNLIFRYPSLRFIEDPVKMKLFTGGFWNNLLNFEFFTTGVNKLEDKLTEKLDEDLVDSAEPIDLIQTFHLLFHSRSPEEYTVLDTLPDCRTLDGKPLGYTGTEYLPNIAYDWKFKEGNAQTLLEEDLSRKEWCDVDKDGIYCDATQFSIELLLKIKEINEFVKNNAENFVCPPSYKQQDLVSDINNIGITYLEANKESDNNNRLTYDLSIKGNYDVDIELERPLFDIKTVVDYKNPNSFVWQNLDTFTQTIDASYISEGVIDEEFNTTVDISSINDNAKIRINSFIDSNSIVYDFISELESGNNSLDNSLEIILSGPSGCSLETNSLNISEYVLGSNNSLPENLIEFESYLMLDGYSSDFQKDFDQFYRNQFATGNNWYNEQTEDADYTPIYKYFSTRDNFVFRTALSDPTKDLVIPGPGKYKVQIEIDYDDNWKLFNEAGEPTGKINIILEKELKPEIDMPIYYMPIDGVVGVVDSTRINYGVSYINDVISLDQSVELAEHNLDTQGFTSSSPINIINVNEIDDFKTMNIDNRGQILSITTDNTHSSPSLRFSPSRASPVALRLERNTGDAFAFYKLAIGTPPGQGGYVAHPGSHLTYWTGFENCDDFTGVPSIEAFKNRADIVATHSQLAPFTQSDTYSYGVEFPKEEIIRTGNLWLKTILYTPSNYTTGTGISYLSMDSYSDEAKFYTPNNLQGSSEIELNAVDLENFSGDIGSLRDVYDLIASKNACVDFDSTSFKVYYNPKKVIDVLTESLNENIYNDESLKCIGYQGE